MHSSFKQVVENVIVHRGEESGEPARRPRMIRMTSLDPRREVTERGELAPESGVVVLDDVANELGERSLSPAREVDGTRSPACGILDLLEDGIRIEPLLGTGLRERPLAAAAEVEAVLLEHAGSRRELRGQLGEGRRGVVGLQAHRRVSVGTGSEVSEVQDGPGTAETEHVPYQERKQPCCKLLRYELLFQQHPRVVKETTPLSNRERPELLEPLVEIARDLTASLAAEDRYSRLLAAVRRIVPCDAACLLRLEGETLVPLAGYGLADEALAQRYERREHPRLDVILRSQDPIRFPPTAPSPIRSMATWPPTRTGTRTSTPASAAHSPTAMKSSAP